MQRLTKMQRLTTPTVGLGLALLLLAPAVALAGGATRLNSKLAPTINAPGAGGGAILNLRTATQGVFVVAAGYLRPSASYDLIVRGVKVGALQTNRRGAGKTAFSSKPGRGVSVLGFDPRGSHVLLRDATTGTDVLVGTVPDDNPGAEACCLTSPKGEVECEDLSAAACTAAGGAPQAGVNSCLPNPCSDNRVCCINTTHDDGAETECEEFADAACAAAGGTIVQAASCDTNPCQPAPPVNVTTCCISKQDDDGENDSTANGGSENECETLSAEACTAAGGVPNSAASCNPNPCPVTPPGPPPAGTSACCVPDKNAAEPPECELLSADACTTAGGTVNASTTCSPSPC